METVGQRWAFSPQGPALLTASEAAELAHANALAADPAGLTSIRLRAATLAGEDWEGR